MMTASKSTSKSWRSPVTLIRISAILWILTMLGHLAAYPWTSTTNDPREAALVASMKETPYLFFSNTPFAYFGEQTTYWGLYLGWGLLLPVVSLALAAMLWILSDLARVGPRSVAVICGIVSATNLVAVYISLRFFFTPPVVTYSIACVLLMAAAVQLWNRHAD